LPGKPIIKALSAKEKSRLFIKSTFHKHIFNFSSKTWFEWSKCRENIRTLDKNHLDFAYFIWSKKCLSLSIFPLFLSLSLFTFMLLSFYLLISDICHRSSLFLPTAVSFPMQSRLHNAKHRSRPAFESFLALVFAVSLPFFPDI